MWANNWARSVDHTETLDAANAIVHLAIDFAAKGVVVANNKSQTRRSSLRDILTCEVVRLLLAKDPQILASMIAHCAADACTQTPEIIRKRLSEMWDVGELRDQQEFTNTFSSSDLLRSKDYTKEALTKLWGECASWSQRTLSMTEFTNIVFDTVKRILSRHWRNLASNVAIVISSGLAKFDQAEYWVRLSLAQGSLQLCLITKKMHL